MKNKNIIEGILLFFLSSFFIKESLKLHRRGDWALSPALFPLIITIGLFILSMILVYRGFKGERDSSVGGDNFKSLVFIFAISFLYLALLGKIGFVFTSIIYIFLFMLVLGEKRWWLLGLISIITPSALYYIFVKLLDVYLP